MKRIGTLLPLILFLTETFGQRQGYTHTIFGEVPSVEVVGKNFLYAFGIALVGFISYKASYLFKKEDEETIASKIMDFITLLCCPSVVFFLIPLAEWIWVFAPYVIIPLAILFGLYLLIKYIKYGW
jgi:hypothetical protein